MRSISKQLRINILDRKSRKLYRTIYHVPLLTCFNCGHFVGTNPSDRVRNDYERLTFEERAKLGLYNYPSISTEDKEDPRDAGDLRINA